MNRKKFISNLSDFVQIALKLNGKANEQGLLSLENELEDLDDEYFKTGMRMVVEGVDSGIIDEILVNKLSFVKNKYTRIYMSIVKRAVLGIQNGLPGRVLFFILLSMAGLSPKEQRQIEIELPKD